MSKQISDIRNANPTNRKIPSLVIFQVTNPITAIDMESTSISHHGVSISFNRTLKKVVFIAVVFSYSKVEEIIKDEE